MNDKQRRIPYLGIIIVTFAIMITGFVTGFTKFAAFTAPAIALLILALASRETKPK